MTRSADMSGISVVAVGAFNPAIFHPLWFADKDLLPRDTAEDALEHEFVATRELAAFTADWLSVQVTLEQAAFSTAEAGREFDLRDLARGVFDLLPETPVNAIGINSDVHFRVDSEDAWHAIGDRFLPKDFWEPLFEGDDWKRRGNGEAVGMRSMTVEVHREDIAAYVRTEIAPSARLTPHGVYTGINSHFQLSVAEERGTGYKAARIIDEQWDPTRKLEQQLIERILEIA